MSLKLGLNLGYWGIGPAGRRGRRDRAGRRGGGLRLRLGRRVLRLRRGQRARLAGGRRPRRSSSAPRSCRCPARAARRRGDGRRDDRRALRRPLHLRLRPLGPAGLRGLVRRPLREAVGAHPRVRRGRPGDHRPRGSPRARGRALSRCRCPRAAPAGQGAEAQLPPGARPRSRSSSARSAASRSRWRPRSATAGSRSSSASTSSSQTWGEHIEAGLDEGRALARETSRSRPRCRSRSTATSTPPAASSRRACCSTSAAWARSKTNFYVDLTHRFGFGEVADEVQCALPGRQARGGLRRDPRRARRRHLDDRHRGRGRRAGQALRGRRASTA